MNTETTFRCEISGNIATVGGPDSKSRMLSFVESHATRTEGRITHRDGRVTLVDECRIRQIDADGTASRWVAAFVKGRRRNSVWSRIV